MKEHRKNTQTLVAYLIALTGFFVVLVPLLYYRENYFFTIHDYLDSWPSLFEVLRRSKLFFSLDSSMPIMEGISTCYLYFDFGVYRLLNFFFGPIWGEIVNKAISLGVGFYTARRLFAYILEVYNIGSVSKKSAYKSLPSEEWIVIFLAAAYAFTSVYPNWTISFAFLPLYFEMLLKIIREEDGLSIQRLCLSLSFGFLVYFPCIGIFILGVYFIALLIDTIKNKKIKKAFFLYVVSMLVSTVIANINIFIYVLRGDGLNRSLVPTDITWNIFNFVRSMAVVGLIGQTHAAPVLYILTPLCVAGYVVLFFQLRKKQELKQITLPTAILGLIITFCFIYSLDEARVIRYVVSRVLPILAGFNLGRFVYFNNILWYVLFLTIFKRLDRNRMANISLFIILAFNVLVVVMCPGAYKETSANIFRERSLLTFFPKASFAEFYDTDYFESLKEEIEYDNEGVISVGYHPAVAMFNGFNTLDGYVSINPLDYHYRFREIIAPALDVYPGLEAYYDTWGGRIYCYIDETRNVGPDIVTEGGISALRMDKDTRTGFLYDLARIFGYSEASNDAAPAGLTKDGAKDLLINTDAFYDMGGRYILSKYELANADELGLFLVEHKTDIESSIYQTWVYKVRGGN